MKKLRVAIIGNGGICNAVHVPQYLKMTDTVEVVALCDIILERAEALRDRAFPNADVYANYQDIIDRADIDCVDVCTPNYLHSIIAVAALKSGKHVFTEKPDAINVEEAEKMKRAAEESGKVLMVMRNNRHVNTSQYLKKYIADGKAGELYAGRCGWIRRRGIPGKGGWFTTKAQSGDHIKIFTEENGLPVDLIPQYGAITGGHGPNLAHFYDVVANGAEPDFVPQQGVNMIKILSAIYESAETGKEVRL